MGGKIGDNHSKPSRLAFGQRYAGLCPLWVKSGHKVNVLGAIIPVAVPYALSPRREAGVVPGFGLTEDGAGVIHIPGLFD